jgi:hypothetical protein
MTFKKGIDMKITADGDGLYEVHPVHELEELDENGRPYLEACDDDFVRECKLPHFWSVYEHQKHGGIECIADVPTEEYANAILEALDERAPERMVWIFPPTQPALSLENILTVVIKVVLRRLG